MNPLNLPEAEFEAYQRVRLDGHRAMAAQSQLGVERIVPGANHGIQITQPQAVIEAVREVLAQARGVTR